MRLARTGGRHYVVMRAHLLLDAPLAAVGLSATIAGHIQFVPALAGVSIAIHAWGVMDPRSSLYLPVWWRLPAGEEQLALTFDDGPHPEVTPRVLDRLAASGQRGTFFLIGENAQRYPALVRRILVEGHALGLHSYSHSRFFSTWLPARIAADIMHGAEVLADITGGPAPTLFRPPVGLKNPMVALAVQRLALRTVTWSCRGRDTTLPPLPVLMRRLRAGLVPRAILLLHDGHEPSRPADRMRCLDALDDLLPRMQELGLSSRPLTRTADGIALGP
jgi:peptidoglycan-N-acetylglucosamine deacetylase